MILVTVKGQYKLSCSHLSLLTKHSSAVNWVNFLRESYLLLKIENFWNPKQNAKDIEMGYT